MLCEPCSSLLLLSFIASFPSLAPFLLSLCPPDTVCSVPTVGFLLTLQFFLISPLFFHSFYQYVIIFSIARPQTCEGSALIPSRLVILLKYSETASETTAMNLSIKSHVTATIQLFSHQYKEFLLSLHQGSASIVTESTTGFPSNLWTFVSRPWESFISFMLL